MHAELDAILCSGPRKGKQFTYALLEERVHPVAAITRDEALAALATRYFSTRGPATLNDFAWWSGLTVADGRQGLDLVNTQFISETVDSKTYWFPPSMSPARKKSSTAFLLPNYDEFVVGFKDRSAIGRAANKAGIQRNDVALLANVILIDGQIVGGWKRILEKDKVRLENSLLASV